MLKWVFTFTCNSTRELHSSTELRHSTVRNQIADEVNLFLELDKIIQIRKKVCLTTKKTCPVIAFLDKNILTVQSSKFVDGISLFMLRIYNNLCFETFHFGAKCYINRLSKNWMNTIDTLWKLEEIIRYLNSMAFDHKKISLVNNFLTMALKKYSSDIVICAFGYYVTSRTLYNRLRDNFQLSSLATLGRMTSKVSKLKKSFLLSIFNTLNTNQPKWLHDLQHSTLAFT